MNMNQPEKRLHPTEREYHLNCKVVVKEISYEDEQSKGSSLNTAKMVFLIPSEGSQRDLFFAAWLPEAETERNEIGLIIGNPVNGPCRASVMRKNKNLSEHHIFVMSFGAEQDLVQFADSKKWFNIRDRKISVTVLPENADVLLDQASDGDVTGGIFKKYEKKGDIINDL